MPHALHAARRSRRPRRGPRAASELGLVIALLFGGSACRDALERERGVGAAMFLESCSLACSRGDDGVQVFCSTVNTYQNRDVILRFSQPVEPSSIRPAAFRVVEAATGIAPAGRLLLDPTDERGLIFRPALTFDTAGVPVHGLRQGVAYRISVAGERQGDPGPFLRSRSGVPNLTRMDCTIITDQGVLDPVPGAPGVEVFADVVTARDADGNPIQVQGGARLPRQPLELVDVHRTSPLRFVFADVMNPATLARNASGEAPFVRVEMDGDGLIETEADRSQIPGRFEVRVDVDALVTELVFHPEPGYPSAGSVDASGTGQVRFVVVTIPTEVTDLVGNPVPIENGGGRLAFVPERIDFPVRTLPGPGGVLFEHEPGAAQSWADAWRTGARWGEGRLRAGIGSGSGRLGELVVRSGEVIELDTERQVFPLPGRSTDQCGNRDPAAGHPGTPGAELLVSDGVFEFAALRIESGGRLVLRGRHPARVLVSGPLVVHQGGILDLSGGTPVRHDASITHPELGLDVRRIGAAFVPVEVSVARGLGGPGGGDGGLGADRHDFGPHGQLLGLSFPSDARDLTGFAVDPTGRRGEGIGGSSLNGFGGGAGGARAPVSYPTTPSTLAHESGSSVAFNIESPALDDVCLARQLGGTGGGGGYATAGGDGHAVPREPCADYPIGLSNIGPSTPGGRVSPWVLGPPDDDDPARQLAGPGDVFLRGGAGGGGGGSHGYDTRAAGLDGDATHACIGIASPFVEWHDHSGAPGGGGGGACKLTSAAGVHILGLLDASGGDGGRGSFDGAGRFALPGGAGAGGGVRLQGERVELGPGSGRIDVRGGQGGRFYAEDEVRGGDGGVGLVRIEDRVGELDRAALARAILPFDAADDSRRWLSVGPGDWQHAPDPPECLAAATSCWMRPEGLFYTLDFIDDRGARPANQGWNVDLEWRVGEQLVRVPFRGDNPWYPLSLEEVLGNVVGDGRAGGGSAIAVRFQGARARGAGDRFCERPLDGVNGAAQEGTVTPWVLHPAELNAFEPRPDMLRFCIVLDPSAPAWHAPDRTLEGLTALWVRARPE